MATAYADVVRALGLDALAACRSNASAEAFSQASGLRCLPGGVARLLEEDRPASSRAIVAVPVEELAPVAQALADAGITDILVEKPAGVDLATVEALAARTRVSGARLHVAYNRRFYASVRMLRKMAVEDGGIVSLNFDFTELSDRVAGLLNPRAVMENWGIANSTHVIDTAFFLAGMPKVITGLRAGGFAWHPKAARYAGHGVTEHGALFTYTADWDAPGRWGIEVNTRLRKYVLRPMEKLAVQQRNAFSLDPVDLDDDLDLRFKPGLFRQVKAFLGQGGMEDLLSLEAHASRLSVIDRAIFNAPCADAGKEDP